MGVPRVYRQRGEGQGIWAADICEQCLEATVRLLVADSRFLTRSRVPQHKTPTHARLPQR